MGPNWYIQYGMDLAANEGTEVYAAFDAHITKFQQHDPSGDTDKVFGAQIFMRSPNDQMGAFYTHLTDVPDGIGVNSVVARGDLIGTIYKFRSTPTHLHIALVEIIGGAPGGQYVGVDLYQFFQQLETKSMETIASIQFWQNGSPPDATLS
jgi:murein DD-endopeptidase MepM/ murein hydrolase activator NlpD